MILAPHFLASAALASQVKKPILIAIFAVILHFLIDRISHWDYKLSEKPNSKWDVILPVSADLLFGVITVAVIAAAGDWTFRQYFLANFGAFFGLLPDGFIALWKIYPQNKYLSAYHRVKKKLHVASRPDFKNGVPQEIAVVIIAILILTVL